MTQGGHPAPEPELRRAIHRAELGCAAAMPFGAIASPAGMLIELQSHSTVSDGQLSPAEVVAQAFPPATGGTGSVTHYVTGGVPAYQHTAQVIGGVEGRVIPLDIVRLGDAAMIRN